VTVAAETDEVRERAAKAFGAWRTALAEALHQAGLDAAAAKTTAALLLSACEGAVVFAPAFDPDAPGRGPDADRITV
jgi:hypothetical protein